MTSPARYAPGRLLPPYSFVPGRNPHPVSDPAGHSYATPPEHPAPPDPARWQESEPYLVALDLFNHGYYWEAHEAWEGLWHACGRSGTVADFLKGLIKLAAAGVKVRQGRPAGARSHAARAGELFARTAAALGPPPECYLGLDLQKLQEAAERVRDQGSVWADATDAETRAAFVFDFALHPEPWPGERKAADLQNPRSPTR